MHLNALRRTDHQCVAPTKVLIPALVVSSLLLGGCTRHNVTQSAPCTAVTAQRTVVVASSRGAIGLAKLGVTPARLKASDKCS